MLIFANLHHALFLKWDKPMKNRRILTEREISVINKLMEKDSEILLQPRKNGYIIFEVKKKQVYRSDKDVQSNNGVPN